MASEQIEGELRKLQAIATGLELGVELRMVAARERETVIKLSQAIVKSGN